MTPQEPTPPPRRMPANLELVLRIVGLGAILVATLVDEAYSRWLAVGGGLWLAGIFLYRAASEQPGPIRRHLFWAAVFLALSAWLWTRT